jgi:putative hydrolase of the HAD superfamily
LGDNRGRFVQPAARDLDLTATTRQMLWLFDLDDTLHRATPVIFGRMNAAMTQYLMRHMDLDEPQANALRREYWLRYGATLLGLTRRHGIDAAHFLRETHQFPDLHRILDYDRRLRRLIKILPGRKVIVTNAPRHYAQGVLRLLGVNPHLHGVETIESMRFIPKPARSSLARILKRHQARGRRVVMVEDNLENLKTARRLGLTTVWVSRESGRPAFVDVKLKSVLQLSKYSRLYSRQ